MYNLPPPRVQAVTPTCPGPEFQLPPRASPMKSIRVLLTLCVFAACAGLVSAESGSCPKKDSCPKAEKTCAATCEQPKEGCPAGCEKPCCANSCAKNTEACPKVGEKSDTAMACCVEAAKAGKVCEKCNPPATK